MPSPCDIRVKVDLSKIRQAYKIEDLGLFKDVYEAWATFYRAEMTERFLEQSRGGGEWPPLAESTVRGRRKARKTYKGKKRKIAILIDTATLLTALSPTIDAPGQYTELLQKGIRVGIGGIDVHPKGKVTIGQIAEYHQKGGPHLPKRRILVPPNQATRDLMADAMSRKVQEIAKGMT